MKKLITIVSTVCVLLVSMSVALYFTVILPGQNTEKLNFEKQKHQEEQSFKAEQAKKQDELKRQELIRDLDSDCQKKITALKKQYYNVFGGYYSAFSDICYVRYTDTKTHETEEAPVENMEPVN